MSHHIILLHATVILQKLPRHHLVKEFSAVYGTLRSITVFTATSYWSLVCATFIQTTPSHPSSLKSILTLPSHL
jgi:hypothetical protein